MVQELAHPLVESGGLVPEDQGHPLTPVEPGVVGAVRASAPTVDIPHPRSRASTSSGGPPDTTGTWKSEPA